MGPEAEAPDLGVVTEDWEAKSCAEFLANHLPDPIFRQRAPASCWVSLSAGGSLMSLSRKGMAKKLQPACSWLASSMCLDCLCACVYIL